MSEPITCNLAQNALDYLILAGEQAREDSPRMLKHSVATLADGVELLLKARLEIYDWCLLFREVDRANKEEYHNGDFQSVTIDQAVNRLKNICGVTIDERHLKIIGSLRRLRNKIRHFAVDSNREEAISLITKSYSFAIDFTSQHLESHYGADIEQELDKIRRMLGEFDEFVDSRIKEIQQTIQEQDYAWHVECPKCTQETLYPSDGHATCAFCGYAGDGEAVASDLVDFTSGPYFSPKDQLEKAELIESCPECGADACIYNETKECWICMSCGESGEYNRCNYCFILFPGEPAPGGACQACWQRILEKND